MITAPTETPLEREMDTALLIPMEQIEVYLTCLLFPTCLDYDMEGPLLLPLRAQSVIQREEAIRTNMTIELLSFQQTERKARKKETHP